MKVTAKNYPQIHAAMVEIERDNGAHLIGRVYPGEVIDLDAFDVPESRIEALPATEEGLKKLAVDEWMTFVIGEQSEAEEIERKHGLEVARKLLNDWFNGWEDM